MGQVNYKTDYATFSASQHHAEEDAYADDEAYTGKCLRPRVRITRALAGALLFSVVAHGIFTVAIALSPTAPPAITTEQSSYFSSPRVVHLDWDQYHGKSDESGAADTQADNGSANNTPQKPEAAAAVAESDRSHDRKAATQREIPSKRDTQREEDDHNAVATAPVDALVDTGDDAKIQLPDSDGTPTSAEQADGSDQNTEASTMGGGGTGSDHNSAGIARGPHRRADSAGDGTSEDHSEIRRGHLSQLNRAIRKKNPCTRKLAHRGLSGDVVLGLTQHSSGRVNEVRVLRSSGEPLIDDAAKQFVRNQHSLPAPSDSLTGDVWKIGLRFKCGS